MKKHGKDLMTALMMGILVPFLMLNTARLLRGDPGQEGPTLPSAAGTTAGQTAPGDMEIPVILADGAREIMPLEEYLVGVVLGEMPASFELEALKAQAVVARTYTLRRYETASKHPGGAVCTQPDCCQAYTAAADYLEKGGTRDSVDKVTQAVMETQGLVLTYEGRLIEATYFSSSGGRTEDALAVWGSDLPYLQATDSPEEDYTEQYMETVTMTTDEFQSALGLALSGRSETWIGNVTYTNGGGVDTIVIGGQNFKGTEVRSLLGLRSTAFVLTAVGDTVTITTRGHGHRVGMSQYGAEAMAVDGSTFNEILAHYYRGTTLEEYIDKSTDLG